jgi:hypothetical protein
MKTKSPRKQGFLYELKDIATVLTTGSTRGIVEARRLRTMFMNSWGILPFYQFFGQHESYERGKYGYDQDNP